MDYRGKNCIITGRLGFIGNALGKRLILGGADVFAYERDTRDPVKLRSFVNHKIEYNGRIDYFFHFGSPSSQVLFQRDALNCVDNTVTGFINVARVCRDYGIKLIYPSTGILSQGVENEYSRCKKICEDIHLKNNLNALGLRIFAGYGVGESHKEDYASVPYIFCRNAIEARPLIIYGDGSQTRDFIYIDDLINAILVLTQSASEQVVDIGSGESRSFKKIAEAVASLSLMDTEIIYKDVPPNYVKDTRADVTVLKKYGIVACSPLKNRLAKILEVEAKRVYPEDVAARYIRDYLGAWLN